MTQKKRAALPPSRSTTRRGIPSLASGTAILLSLGVGTALAQTPKQSQTPAPTQTTIPEEGPVITPEANPFLDKATAGYQFRVATFDRWSPGSGSVTFINQNGQPQTATAQPQFKQEGAGFGGWLYGNTGELANFLSFAGTFNFTIPLYNPKEYPYNYILKDPNQQGYAVVAEANARMRYQDNVLVLGYQSINYAWYLPDVYRFYNKLDQAMIGRRDVRAMQPITYLAATFGGKVMADTLRYWAGYVWDMKQINDNRFRNLYQGAYQTTCWPESSPSCSKQGDSNGMAYVGIQWKPNNESMYQASYYNVQNLLNMAYADGDWVFRVAERRYFRLGAQWMYQSSSGDSLTTGSAGKPGYSFSTNYGGLYFEGRPTDWLIPYGSLGLNASGGAIQAPYSIGPSYQVQRIGENSKAGERTWIVGTILDFGSVGLNGLSFDTSYGQRSNRKIDANNPNGGGQPLADWNELALDLVYIFPKGSWFQNLRARARYAKVWQDGQQWVGVNQLGQNVYQDVNTTQQDVRFDLGFVIPFR